MLTRRSPVGPTVAGGQRNPAARGVGRQSQRRAKRGGLRGEAVQNLEEARGGPRGSGVLCGGREHDGAGGNKEGASSSSSNGSSDPYFGGSLRLPNPVRNGRGATAVTPSLFGAAVVDYLKCVSPAAARPMRAVKTCGLSHAENESCRLACMFAGQVAVRPWPAQRSTAVEGDSDDADCQRLRY